MPRGMENVERGLFKSNINTASLLAALAAFLGGMLFNAFTIAQNIATKPYVDEGLANQKKYTDEKSALILKEAIEHSNRNHDDMIIRMKDMVIEVRAQTVKQDLLIELVKKNEERLYRAERR